MGRRLTESFKFQIKAYHRQSKKTDWLKTLPTFRNFDINHDDAKGNPELVSLVVTDLLKVEEKPMKTVALGFKESGSMIMIDAIRCPCCGGTLTRNTHWNCYICANKPAHDKKVFEIKGKDEQEFEPNKSFKEIGDDNNEVYEET